MFARTEFAAGGGDVSRYGSREPCVSSTGPFASSPDRSHALRGNASTDAPRSAVGWDAERPGLRSHAERGNDHGAAGARSKNA
nr:hypothetical protein FEE99_24890 [Pseudomonas sp. ef1]